MSMILLPERLGGVLRPFCGVPQSGLISASGFGKMPALYRTTLHPGQIRRFPWGIGLPED